MEGREAYLHEAQSQGPVEDAAHPGPAGPAPQLHVM